MEENRNLVKTRAVFGRAFTLHTGHICPYKPPRQTPGPQARTTLQAARSSALYRPADRQFQIRASRRKWMGICCRRGTAAVRKRLTAYRDSLRRFPSAGRYVKKPAVRDRLSFERKE